MNAHDGHEHCRKNCGGAQWGEQSKRQENPACTFAQSGGRGKGDSRTEAQLFKDAARPFETIAAKPPKQFLGAMGSDGSPE